MPTQIKAGCIRFVSMIFTVVGARPNYMKAAPIHRAFERAGIPHALIHTGQHYDRSMSDSFFEQLGMPTPVVNLGVGSGSHAEQTGAVMVGLERYLSANRPRALLLVGDINSTLAGAIVAAKAGIFCGHVEAGLRSRDRSMPEEINRIVTDALSNLLLTPSADGDANLLAEGRRQADIVRVGNVMIDTLFEHLPAARELALPAQLGLAPGAYAVLTLHRPSNVDDTDTLSGLLRAVTEIANKLPVVFPVHPRTRKQIASAGLNGALEHPGICAIEPLGYLDFLSLTSSARLILTDSGGLQEESTVLGIPCLTLRENTERPVTITHGTNRVVGTDSGTIAKAAHEALTAPQEKRVPELWDGRTADRIVAAVMQRLT